MSTGLTNTHRARGCSDLYHVFARKQCILCYALRHKRCLTLLYVTSIRDFSAPGTIAHGYIRLLVGSYVNTDLLHQYGISVDEA